MASPGGLLPCSAPLCCGWRGEGAGSEEDSCHLDPGLSISAAVAAALGADCGQIRGDTACSSRSCCAATTQAGNKASFFMQRCTMVNREKLAWEACR